SCAWGLVGLLVGLHRTNGPARCVPPNVTACTAGTVAYGVASPTGSIPTRSRHTPRMHPRRTPVSSCTSRRPVRPGILGRLSCGDPGVPIDSFIVVLIVSFTGPGLGSLPPATVLLDQAVHRLVVELPAVDVPAATRGGISGSLP